MNLSAHHKRKENKGPGSLKRSSPSSWYTGRRIEDYGKERKEGVDNLGCKGPARRTKEEEIGTTRVCQRAWVRKSSLLSLPLSDNEFT